MHVFPAFSNPIRPGHKLRLVAVNASTSPYAPEEPKIGWPFTPVDITVQADHNAFFHRVVHSDLLPANKVDALADDPWISVPQAHQHIMSRRAYVKAGVLGEGGESVERHRPDVRLVDCATVLSEKMRGKLGRSQSWGP